MQLNPPKDINQFFIWLKEKSEIFWQNIKIDHEKYGFQTQKDTKWNAGLTNAQIKSYEKDLGFEIPEIYKTFLRHMNGTDKMAVNVYGESGEPYAYASAYYSYPRDLKIVKKKIKWICNSLKIQPEDMDGDEIPYILPIVSHRFFIIDKAGKNPVLSMYEDDIIIYASSLQSFLVYAIFKHSQREENLKCEPVNFWLPS